MIPTPQTGAPMFGRVDNLHMSANQRLRINAYMQDGELIAELFCRVLGSIRSAIALAGRGAKAMFAGPARH